MNCSSCAGTMTQVRGQDHFHCHGCNQFHFASSIEAAEDALQPAGKATEFECPRCRVPLEVGELRGMLNVCFCPNCRGFVIDSESLGAIINDLRSNYDGPDDQPRPVDPNDLDAKQTCPACLEPMDAHPYYGPGNVVIDTCMNCQLVWFDHGELARIVRAPGARPEQPSEGNFESANLKQAIQKNAEARKFGFFDVFIQSFS